MNKVVQNIAAARQRTFIRTLVIKPEYEKVQSYPQTLSNKTQARKGH